MAITPKKKTQNPLATPGGGAKGGSMGTGGRAGKVTKLAPKPKVSLKPEPSSVTVKANKYNIYGPSDAAAANKSLVSARSRVSTASPKAQKRALKAANKTLKTKSADAARKQSFDRAQTMVDKRNSLLQQGKSVKELNDSMKFTRRNSLRFNADGSKTTPRQAAKDNKAFVKGGKKPSKLSQAIAKKMYPKGIPSSKNK